MTFKVEFINTFLQTKLVISSEEFFKFLLNSYLDFQEIIVPVIRKYYKTPCLDNIDLIFFILFILFTALFISITVEHLYEEFLSDSQKQSLIDKYRSLKEPFVLFSLLLKKIFSNIVTALDDVVVANIIWWTNIIVACLYFYSLMFEVELLIIDQKVYMVFVLFSFFALLCYDPKK